MLKVNSAKGATMPLIANALPMDAMKIIERVHVPWPLLFHHYIVHDVADDLCSEFQRLWPRWRIDVHAVLIGAATHDLGKTLHPAELHQPGTKHLATGERLLRALGLSARLARFARTHGATRLDDLPMEDLLVALADRSWSGGRDQQLEEEFMDRAIDATGCAKWDAIHEVGHMIDGVQERALARLRCDLRPTTAMLATSH